LKGSSECCGSVVHAMQTEYVLACQFQLLFVDCVKFCSAACLTHVMLGCVMLMPAVQHICCHCHHHGLIGNMMMMMTIIIIMLPIKP
jgi:hypothetical protein